MLPAFNGGKEYYRDVNNRSATDPKRMDKLPRLGLSSVATLSWKEANTKTFNIFCSILNPQEFFFTRHTGIYQ